MDHLAIMRKSWGLTSKILNGQKKIESRWYNSKYAPWNKIKSGDTVYFKDSGEAVTIKAKVIDVMQFENLAHRNVKEILDKYYIDDGIDLKDLPDFYERFKDKKYCLLIFLDQVQSIEPFQINKKGYGMMSAWITIDDINKLKASA